MKRGIFVAFEGGEGSGKSSTLAYVAETLRARGVDVVATREPGGSPFAEQLRLAILSGAAATAHPETLFHLFWLARSDHLANTIIPALSRGAVVISDRFDGSTYAYQVVAEMRTNLRQLFWRMRAQYVGQFAPTRYFNFDIDPLIGLQRAKRRRDDVTHFDAREIEFHQRVRAGFTEFFEYEEILGSTIDASQPQDAVRKQITDMMNDLIPAA